MKVLLAVPLLLLPVLGYHVLVFLTGTDVEAVAIRLDLASGAVFTLTAGQLLMASALVFLYLEILKSTRTGTASIVDHMLSILLMVVCIVELILLPAMATGTFFLITLMTLIDVIAGFTVTITAARRDFGMVQG